MTERRIFEILLRNHKNEDFSFDFPKLQKEAADLAALKFTNIIYETLKQKSSASKIKRGDVLKYINNMCEVRESHLSENSYKCFMKVVKRSLEANTNNGDLSKLLSGINSELHTYAPDNLSNNMFAFYRRKHAKQKEKIKCLEFIKKLDQEKLESKFNIQVRRNFNYYETNENLIKDLLEEDSCPQLESKSIVNSMETTDYRERQIKLAYAVINTRNEDTAIILEQILYRISKYTPLEAFETNFIQYLWVLEGETFNNLAHILVTLFPFLLERLILKYCTKILRFNEEVDVYEYLRSLEVDKKFTGIRRICIEDAVIYHKLKSIVYELYCYSFCNDNLLKFMDLLV